MGISKRLNFLCIACITLAIGGTLSVADSPVYAGAFGLDEQGAAAMGRANAFVAQADDTH